MKLHSLKCQSISYNVSNYNLSNVNQSQCVKLHSSEFDVSCGGREVAGYLVEYGCP